MARILAKFNIKTAFKAIKTLEHIFKKTKLVEQVNGKRKVLFTKLYANPAHSRTSVNKKDIGIPGAVNTSAPKISQ